MINRDRADNSAEMIATRPQIKQSWIAGLACVVAGFAVLATSAGILTAFGHPHHVFTSLFGEQVQIQGGGLYAHESVSMAAQGVGMDLVTLLVATPLLLASTWFARRGSLRGQLLRVGAFFYFTYSYLVIGFGVVYNPLFLVYVALLSASGAGLILSLLTIDVVRLPAAVSNAFRRRGTAWTVIGVSALFLVMWLGRILPAVVSGRPPVGLDSYTTLSVQAADLGIVIPLSLVTGVLLLRRSPAGYLLAAPVLVFLATMGLGLVGMVVAMAAMGTSVGPADAIPAVVTAVLGIALALHFTASVGRSAGSRVSTRREAAVPA
jgi:hypothetical protein